MAVSKLVDPGASFIQESNQVASCFLELYFEDPKNRGVNFTTRSPAPPRRIEADSASSEWMVTGAGGPPPPNAAEAAALRIAQKLKQIGDEIDEKVRKQLEDAFTDEIKKGVFQIGREQFSRMCRSVLYKCSESLQNGWQQASVVYMGMARMVGEMRRHEDTAQRENVMQNITSETLQSLGLDEWIEQHGGFVNFGERVEGQDALVPIEGTPVDA